MKKILTLIIAIITISLLAGCSTYTYINSYPVNIDDLTVEYIRTNGYYEDIEYPLVFVIKGKDQLESYFNEKKERLEYYFDISLKTNTIWNLTVRRVLAAKCINMTVPFLNQIY